MKTKFLMRVSILSMFLFVIFSCSKDETNNNVSQNAKVNSYLKNFYKTDYRLGKSVEGRLPRQKIMQI